MNRHKLKTKVTESTKLRTCCAFKENTYLELGYVVKIKIDKIGLSFDILDLAFFTSRLKLGGDKILSLKIMVCQICYTVVDDKNQLVFNCSRYNKERDNFKYKMCSIGIRGYSHVWEKNLELLYKKKIF